MGAHFYPAVIVNGIVSWIFGCTEREQPSPTESATTARSEDTTLTSHHTPADAYTGLRSRVLALRPADLGLADQQPFAALMETGYDEGIATLVVIADGTTSLYLSSGGGVIGAGAHAPVRKASSDFLAGLAGVADRLQPTTDVPLPNRGRVRFYLLSEDGIRSAEASEQDLGHNRHELSPIFHTAHEVIAAIREHATRSPVR